MASSHTIIIYGVLLLQAVIDLLIPGQTPGIKEQIVDLYNKPELLFFGPDGQYIMRSTYNLLLILSPDCRGYG